MTVFLLPIALISSVFGLAIFWAGNGLPGLFQATRSILDFCRSVFVFCTGYGDVIKIAILWAGAAIPLAGLIYGVCKGLKGAVGAHLAVKRLPLYDRSKSVVLIKDDNARTAFTHGLLRPRVYISTGLLKGFDRDEVKAVLKHELHHRRRRDPFKFLILSILSDSFFYIPLVKELVKRVRAKREHDADDSVKDPEGRLCLAGALVKAARFNRAAVPASLTGLDPVTARVKRLVEGREARLNAPSFKAVLVSSAMTLMVAASLIMPVRVNAVAECSTDHCAVHMDELGEACKTHCATHGAHHLG